MKNLSHLTHVRLILISLAVMILTACASKVAVSPELQKVKPEVYALLPVTFPSSISRERAQEVFQGVANELRAKGILLLQDDVVQRVCSNPQCPERDALVRKYGIDAFFSLDLNSVSKSNFLAGYYNSISGTLTLVSANGQQLLKVEDSESEKGGFLFNTGQLIEGVKSTVENASQSKLGTLGEKFAAALVAKLPELPSVTSLPEQVTVALNSVEVRTTPQEYARVCAQGSPFLDAYLRIDRRLIGLRETTPGMYCGEFILWGLVSPASKLSVELRSPFGITQQKTLSAENLISCKPQGLVQYSNEDKRVLLTCTKSSDAQARQNCENYLEFCKRARFEFYTLDRSGLAYNRVGSVPASAIGSEARRKGVYEVLAVSRDGSRSVPVELNIQ